MPYVRIVDGPKGSSKALAEVRQMNGVQGWHSGYVDRDEAKKLALDLLYFAFTGKVDATRA